MKLIISDNLRIFLALISRDLKVLRKKFLDALIDGLVLVLLQVIMFGYLFPLMGMEPTLIPAIYVSTIILMIFTISFSQAMRLVFDIKFNHYINYLLTLPLSKPWLFGTYTASCMLETFLTTIPLITVGVLLLKQHFIFSKIQWISLLLFYLLSLLFVALFALTIAFSFSYQWFMDNIWPRVLSPLCCIGAIFFTWQSIYRFEPRIAYIMLLNPFTYIAEGIRTALAAPGVFLPFYVCVGALFCYIGIVSILLIRGIHRRLDPL